MFTKSLIAAAAIAAATLVSVPANAGVHVDVGIGGYPGYYPPVHRHHHRLPPPPIDYGYDGYGYYAPVDPVPVYSGISCEEGRYSVRSAGFYNVRPRDCEGRRFTYKAKRDGETFIVRVSRRSGDIISVDPVY